MADAANDPPGRDDETARLSAHVLALLARVTERFDSEEHEEWQWLTRHSNSSLIVDLLRDSTPTALRVLDAIGRLEPVNGITVAEHARLRRGTVSKITRRLVASDLITQASLPGNKKEKMFRLTPLGKELFEVHRAFDEQMERGFLHFLQRYSADELRLLIRVLQDATRASFLTLGLQTPEEA